MCVFIFNHINMLLKKYKKPSNHFRLNFTQWAILKNMNMSRRWPAENVETETLVTSGKLWNKRASKFSEQLSLTRSGTSEGLIQRIILPLGRIQKNSSPPTTTTHMCRNTMRLQAKLLLFPLISAQMMFKSAAASSLLYSNYILSDWLSAFGDVSKRFGDSGKEKLPFQQKDDISYDQWKKDLHGEMSNFWSVVYAHRAFGASLLLNDCTRVVIHGGDQLGCSFGSDVSSSCGAQVRAAELTACSNTVYW